MSGPRLAILTAIVFATAWAILLAGYGFDGFPLPRLYTDGLALARLKNTTVEGPTYLMGSISGSGFPHYFLVALLVKSPIPLLLLGAAGIAAGLARRERRREILWLVVPAAFWIAAMSLATKAQIGVRYVLPALPFLCMAAGAGLPAIAELLTGGRRASRGGAPAGVPDSAGGGSPGREEDSPSDRLRPPAVEPPEAVRRRRAVAAGALVLIGWQAFSTLRSHPHHLSWFNAIAGGSEGGRGWLTDSNIDWGQDLPGLRRWQVEHGDEPVNLYYFGTADPDRHGIRRHPYGDARPGWFAASATHLAGVYLPDRDYLKALRDREPDASIGGSILLYHLDPVPEELRRPIRRPR